MAETWGLAYFSNLRFVANNTTLITGFNPAGSGVVLRVYRISLITNQQIGVTGLLIATSIIRTTDVDGVGGTTAVRGSRIRGMPLDVRSAPPSPLIEFWTGRNVTQTGIALRRVSVVADDIAVNGVKNTMQYLTVDEPYATIWETAVGGDVQPLTMRAGEGFAVTNATSLAVGAIDFEVLYTTE